MPVRGTPPPRLRHAVAEATEPFSPEPLSLQPGRAKDLLDFLSDLRTTDATYETIIRRARDEPRNWAVVDRCVALLRRSVHAHFPSVTLLRELLSLVSWGLSEAPKESPGSVPALLYLRQVLTTLQRSDKFLAFWDAMGVDQSEVVVKPDGKASPQGRPSFGGTSRVSSPPRQSLQEAAGSTGGTASASGPLDRAATAHDVTLTSMPSLLPTALSAQIPASAPASVAPDAAAAPAPGPPPARHHAAMSDGAAGLAGGARGSPTPHSLSQPDWTASMRSNGWGGRRQVLDPLDNVPADLLRWRWGFEVRPGPATAPSSAPGDWYPTATHSPASSMAVPPLGSQASGLVRQSQSGGPAFLAAAARGFPGRMGSTDRPPALTPAVSGVSMGAFGRDGGGSGRVGRGGPGSMHTAEAAEFASHVRGIVHKQRRDAWAGASEAKLHKRSRAMFAHVPYVEQDPLDIPTAAEVWAIVESVCGAEAVGRKGRTEGDVPEGNLQVPMSLLSKLLIDMWLKLGPAPSLPLGLVIIRRCLASAQDKMRARAFDIIVNLAIHALLIEAPWGSEPSPQAPAARTAQSPSTTSDQHTQHRLARTSYVMGGVGSPRGPGSAVSGEGGGGAGKGVGSTASLFVGNAGGAAHAGWLTGLFHDWLRPLMWEAMAVLAKTDERSSEVWASALGCMVTLCSAGGAFQRSKCEGAPMAALAILLRFCDRQGWSPALRDDLMRLSLYLLFKDRSSRTTSLASDWRDVELDVAKLQAFGGLPAIAERFRWELSADVRQSLFTVALEAVLKRVEIRAMREGLEHPSDVGGVPRPALHRWVAAALFESDDDFPGLLRPYFVMAQEGFALAISTMLFGTTAHPTSRRGAHWRPPLPGVLPPLEDDPGTLVGQCARIVAQEAARGVGGGEEASAALARAKRMMLETVLQEMQVAARALVQLPPTEPESTAHHLQVTVSSLKEPRGAHGATVEAWDALDDLFLRCSEDLSRAFPTILVWVRALFEAAADRKLVPILSGFGGTLGGDEIGRLERTLRNGVLPVPIAHEGGGPAGLDVPRVRDDCDTRLRACVLVPLLQRCGVIGPMALQTLVEGLEVYVRAWLPVGHGKARVPLPGDVMSAESRREGVQVLVHGARWLLEYKHVNGALPAILRSVRVLLSALVDKNADDSEELPFLAETPATPSASASARAMSTSGAPDTPQSGADAANAAPSRHVSSRAGMLAPASAAGRDSLSDVADPNTAPVNYFLEAPEYPGGWGSLVAGELVEVSPELWGAVARDVDAGLVQEIIDFLQGECSLFATHQAALGGLLACPRVERDVGSVAWSPWASAAEDARLLLVVLLLAKWGSGLPMRAGAGAEGGASAVHAAQGFLQDPDARVRFYAADFLQRYIRRTYGEQYREALRKVVKTAQERGDEKLLENPYLIVTAMAQMRQQMEGILDPPK